MVLHRQGVGQLQWGAGRFCRFARACGRRIAKDANWGSVSSKQRAIPRSLRSHSMQSHRRWA
eukprot:934669-Pyramimonas_sp.AAC.1